MPQVAVNMNDAILIKNVCKLIVNNFNMRHAPYLNRWR